MLGNTGLQETEGFGECGTCDVTDQSCLDCTGEAFGEHEVDGCGECLEPEDPQWNQSAPSPIIFKTRKLIFVLSNFLDCMVSLTDFSVTQIWNAQENSVRAFGNLANVDSVTSCSIVDNDATTPDVEVSYES